MNLSANSKKFIESLNARNIEYLVAGAHAMAFIGYPRFTGDIDLFINTTIENAEHIELTPGQSPSPEGTNVNSRGLAFSGVAA